MDETMTPNQVVAWNLRAARERRGWTQEEAASRLEPFIGARWSKATFSAAERSVAGDRIRQFTSDDIVAIARAFEVPIGWLFFPPPDARIATPDSGEQGLPAAALVDVAVSGEASSALSRRRLAFEMELPADVPDNVVTRYQVHARLLATEMLKTVLGDLNRRKEDLRRLADDLDAAERWSAEELAYDFLARFAAGSGSEQIFDADQPASAGHEAEEGTS